MPTRSSEHDLRRLTALQVDHPLATTHQHVAWQNDLLRVECNLVRHARSLEDGWAVRIVPAAEPYYSAIVIPLLADGCFHLVSRFRYPIGNWLLEFPRFDLDNSDSGWKHAAEADLFRITGLSSDRMTLLGAVQIEPALLSTSAVVILAEGCRPAVKTKTNVPPGDPPKGERVVDREDHDDLVAGSLSATQDELLELIRRGHVTCGVTLAALSLLRALPR